MDLDLALSQDRGRALFLAAVVAASGFFAAGSGATHVQASTSSGTYPAKLEVLRAGVVNGRLDVLADITKRADGDRVRVSFIANGRRAQFTAPVEDGRIRFERRLPASQRRTSTGIMEIHYKGNDRVRPTEVRLRAANGKAHLERDLISLHDGAITARGSLTDHTEGVVRLILSYARPDGSVGEWQGRARVRDDGSWGLEEDLPVSAHGGGYLSIQFTGFHPKRIRGEQIAKQLLDGQSFGLGESDSPENAAADAAPQPPAADPVPSLPTPTVVPTPPAPAGVLFSDRFAGPDGAITSAAAYWNPNDSTLPRDRNWEGESGTMYRRSETAAPTAAGGSRFWTTRSDFDNVRVEMDLLNNGFSTGSASSPAVGWDGVKLWLRRQVVNGTSSANVKPGLYTAEVSRRQGNVVIQKKCGGQDAYAILANTSWSGSPNPAKVGEWERVGGTIRTNGDGSVTVQVIRDGAVVLTGEDRGAGGCPPIISPGKVGVRSDNTDFRFDNFTVTAD